jgi:hypothetical protein
MTGAAWKAAQNQCPSFTGLRFVEGRRSPTVLRRLTMSADLRAASFSSGDLVLQRQAVCLNGERLAVCPSRPRKTCATLLLLTSAVTPALGHCAYSY